ncbi:pyridoxamine 5'-phosphate oxidase [Elongatibacter sediminis]|uniref:Pyridoxine/pyridoxamine 5'-phosphate oxidase n=1 Tax=Elongatibacter sediminis TaxID=3119006 RepID=A0AAW9RN43_9GAMM
MTDAILSQTIIDRFNAALDAAREAGEPEPTAMVLATSDCQGRVTTRTVLLKGLDRHGFVFFTNTGSRKGRQIDECPRAAATFLWKSTYCQVQLVGAVRPVTAEEADAYFATRDRGSQIGAWASLQSRTLDSRDTLEARVAEFEERYSGKDVPRPPHWSGYRLQPDSVEFWHGREFRLHDRTEYRWTDGNWAQRKLYP